MWNIMIMKVGRIAVDWGTFLGRGEKGERKELPVWMTAATDGEHKVLIDTGIMDLARVVAGPEPNYLQDSAQRTDYALRLGMGWQPEEVDVVINTHLHYDHCGGNYLFPNAVFYVGMQEWLNADAAAVKEDSLYQKECYSLETFQRKYRYVKGEETVLAGLTVIPTPGHTAGHQSVLLATDQGVVCAAGDSVAVLEQLEENGRAQTEVQRAECRDSINRICQRADYIIPGHEPSLKDFSVTNFPQTVRQIP